MVHEFDSITRDITDLVVKMRNLGWLSSSELNIIQKAELKTPGAIFSNKITRPLVVAFFGGTGVGKSSLLNRIAGKQIAKVGLKRPTSHEITFYLHESVKLAELPDSLPLDKLKVHRHNNDKYLHVLWIDMVDIDSTHVKNQKLVFEWLPYIDLLIYVVSPERYRDDTGWDLLLKRKYKHGWIFVFNRVDEGEQPQLDDFKKILEIGGFIEPFIFRTCSIDIKDTTFDEIEKLQKTIDTVVKAHGVTLLEVSGQKAKLVEIKSSFELILNQFRDISKFENINRKFNNHFQQIRNDILAGMALQINEIATRFSLRNNKSSASQIPFGFMPPFLQAPEQSAPTYTNNAQLQENSAPFSTSEMLPLCESLWDDWAKTKLIKLLDLLQVDAHHESIPVSPVMKKITPLLEKAPNAVAVTTCETLLQSISSPGSRLQKIARKILKICYFIFPIGVVTWITISVVQGYILGLAGEAPFLGFDFLIHSSILILLAWFIPYLLYQILRPSMFKSVRKGIIQGIHLGFSDLEQNCDAIFNQISQEREANMKEADSLLSKISELIEKPLEYDRSFLSQLFSRET